jgi:hypothetical protein
MAATNAIFKLGRELKMSTPTSPVATDEQTQVPQKEPETVSEAYLRQIRNIVGAILWLLIAGALVAGIAGIVAAVDAHNAQVRQERAACNNSGGIWIDGSCD